MMCETEDSGKLRHAAKFKNNEKILLQIRGQDSVAIEVRNHRACYMNYTNFLARLEKSQRIPVQETTGDCSTLMPLKKR